MNYFLKKICCMYLRRKNESCYSQKSCLLYSILYKLPMLFTKWNFVHRKTDLEIQNKFF